MLTGWRYQLAAAAGTSVLTAIALLIANHPLVQAAFTTYVPLFWRLEPTVLGGRPLQVALVVSVAAIATMLAPLYKPRPRRVPDTIVAAQKRTIIAGLGLATFGYFEWSYRLPRATLTMTIGVLTAVLPLWFVVIRLRTSNDTERTIIVGDDMAQIERIIEEIDGPLLGHLCPPSAYQRSEPAVEALADGGPVDTKRIGGLSKLETVLMERDIDTVVLAFQTTDRGEFFGALDICCEYGVETRVLREHADSVLTGGDDYDELVDVDLEPWNVKDHVIKRAFDILFATIALIITLPISIIAAIAIKLDDGGPIFYKQKRTQLFGEQFTFTKFRTLSPNTEKATPLDDDENMRATRVGRVLRKTHFDEIPQLVAILRGDMTVVGPRAGWIDEEVTLVNEEATWPQRWFVKPGLTGLAQINNIGTTEPEKLVKYDIEYIKRQSFFYDVEILVRQIWQVCEDILQMLR